MSKTLAQLVLQLRESDKKVPLIDVFNGTGKTCLSRARIASDDDVQQDDLQRNKIQTSLLRYHILYYNTFTADLFDWHNDLGGNIHLNRLPIESSGTGNKYH